MVLKTSILICKNQHILTFASLFFFVMEQMEKLEYTVFYNAKPLFWDAKKAFTNECASGVGVIFGVLFGTLTCISNQQSRTSWLFDLARFSVLFLLFFLAKSGNDHFSP